MFWNLTDRGDERRLADDSEHDDIRFRHVHCTLHPKEHEGVRERITPLSIALPNFVPQDLVWTWGGECLAQERVLRLFNDSGFVGYDAIPVKKRRFSKSTRRVPKLWQIVVKGSGGMASPESGIQVIRICPGCGLTDYSRITEPARLIDVSRWDGSDFFRVAPVEGFIFVTDRVIQSLRENSITGWKARPLEEMQASFDNVLLVDSTAVN
jgi:hypothetical protein